MSATLGGAVVARPRAAGEPPTALACTALWSEFASRQGTLTKFLQARAAPAPPVREAGGGELGEGRAAAACVGAGGAAAAPLLAGSATVPARGTKRGTQETMLRFVQRGGRAVVRRGAGSATPLSAGAGDVVDVDDEGSGSGAAWTGVGSGAPASATPTAMPAASAAAARASEVGGVAPRSGAAIVWKAILTGPAAPPKCAHREATVSRRVLKVGCAAACRWRRVTVCTIPAACQAGPNCGRMFYTCGRPEGLKTDAAARCGFFQWASDADRSARREDSARGRPKSG